MRLTHTLLALALALPAACSAEGSDESAEDLVDRNTTPMSRPKLDSVIRTSDVRSLGALVPKLPKDFIVNFTLKHGMGREGERGHLVETDVSQSADPGAPRVMMWDERSGFVVSYNGGAEGQTHPDRLDTLEFDETNKAFRMSALEFLPNAPPVSKTDSDFSNPKDRCAHCHGPNQRPIFSMYPDWPQFYGSDNDELTDATKEVQAREARDYAAFRALVSTTKPPRYAPLYDAENVRARFRGKAIYPTFPFRPDHSGQPLNTSRAFTFRPSLRFGILLNRLMAQSAHKQITTHAAFQKHGGVLLHGLLQCGFPSAEALRNAPAVARVKESLGRDPRTTPDGRGLHYRDLLALFGLEVRDLDIRYGYNHAGYKDDDASTNPMLTGYVDGHYWNSYFDGSATIDELLSLALYKTLVADPAWAPLRGKVTSEDGLVVKYRSKVERFRFDKDFFEEMDKRGGWIPIPYPDKLFDLHHRERFTQTFATQHKAVCDALLSSLDGMPSASDSCPASCAPSNYCSNHANASRAKKVGGLPCMKANTPGCQPCP